MTPNHQPKNNTPYEVYKSQTAVAERKGHKINLVFKALPGRVIQEGRRYVEGVSSGIGVDGHQERMTLKAIEGFMQQAQQGDVFLFADIHGIKASQDIGVLVDARIEPNGDWWTKYRIYDELDQNVGPNKLEVCNTVWAQMNGLPPYSHPQTRGFSVEGHIPPGGLISANKDGGERVMDAMVLHGVVLVEYPAYQPSIAQAVTKALDEISMEGPHTLESKMHEERLERLLMERKVRLDEVLDETIEDIMQDPTITDRRNALVAVFNEYRDKMVEILMPQAATIVPQPLPSNIENSDVVIKDFQSTLLKFNKHFGG